MQFTPQQMRGGGRYATHTRIGNWLEEIAVEDCKQADFQRKVSNGNLLLRNHQAKKGQCMQEVPHSYSEDGQCRFGDYITLVHDLSTVQVACDPYDDIFPPWGKFQVSGATYGPAVARTLFRIVRCPGVFKDQYAPNDELLRYGQPFSLICNESLRYTEDSSIRDPDLFLSSTLKNERNATKSSNRQSVFLSAAHTADAVWYCMRPSRGRDPSSERVMAIGHPVSADYSFVLTHHSSNTFLKADAKVREFTDFGVEVEVCAEKSASVGKLGIVVSEQAGLATCATLTKPDIPSNLWHFEYASSPSAAVDRRSVPEVATVDSLLGDIRRQVISSGIFGMVDFRRRVMDSIRGADATRDVSTIVHREDARIALINAGCEYKDTHFDQILSSFDTKKSGHVDMYIILERISKLTEEGVECDFSSRTSLVNGKYRELLGGKKSITIADFAARFYHEDLPFVQDGQYTSLEVMTAFKTAFPQSQKKHSDSAVLKPAQFAGFFADIGASIPDDEYFYSVVNACMR
jgi:hypothetical protein